ncbi:Oidioi.mRNA.OKI2018_I69.XSR.g15661.t1.cds [Oikopleura dioica]|uniref:Oidioi.mRNA.OKI2018_I69.XSR.g15661.t1.cds n=1 Tax=Oikopleura dioica TaxID=34765 RepID=A0ABN7SIN3_OIKDI|nr:Oidioi.mRNA.OKI2018_I69.XSR.g15661.t1.cds [Oikopleura dioica]
MPLTRKKKQEETKRYHDYWYPPKKETRPYDDPERDAKKMRKTKKILVSLGLDETPANPAPGHQPFLESEPCGSKQISQKRHPTPETSEDEFFDALEEQPATPEQRNEFRPKNTSTPTVPRVVQD